MINVNIQGLDATVTFMAKQAPAELEKLVKQELSAFAQNTTTMAQRLSPIDEGHLRRSIAPKVEGLSAEVTVNADYAPYLEFGTKAFAESYVSSLPADWQELAGTFKGRGGGNFEQLVQRLTEWVHRKGLGSGFSGTVGVAGTYSVKTRKRTGAKAVQANQDRQAAYMIARSILKKGIKPHPFLYPAYEANKKKLIDNLKAQFGNA